MNNKEKNNPIPAPFGWRDKIGYLLGNIGNDFTFSFASIFLLVFYTKVLGIASELVGTMFLLARFLDAFTDITMGRIVDRLRGNKNGKFRPWLLRMAFPVAFASFLMYQSSLANASYGLKVTYMFATYLVWGSVFYTAVNIPYGSMASVISPEADHRASLSTARSLGSVLSNLVVGIAAPAMIYTSDQSGNQIVVGESFPRVAAIFSIVAFVCYILCYFLTTERVRTESAAQRPSLNLKETAKTLVTDRALIGIVLASVCVLAAQLLNQAINQYLFIDYFKDKSGVMIMTVASMIPGLLLAPFAVPISRRFGKKEVGIFGCLCGAVSCFLLFILQTTSMWTYIIINILGFLGFGIFNLIMWAFITDIIDDREVRFGTREDGTVYAVYSFARKVGQAIAGGLGGWTLAWIGFDSSQQIQTPQVARGIYNIATIIPAILYFAVALALLFIYPLSKKRVLQNINTLRSRADEVK
ncbi:MAG: MFS transporter [Clostridia bacterium]|nr:MFS transporter [Clostridia bacterium]